MYCIPGHLSCKDNGDKQLKSMLTAAVLFADIHLLQEKAGKVANLDFNHKLGVACLCCSNPCTKSCPPPAVINSCEAHAFAPGWDAEPRSLKNTHGGATLGSFLHRKRGLPSCCDVFSKLHSGLPNDSQNSRFLAWVPSNLLVFL